MSATHIHGRVRAILLANSGVSDIVGTDVYGTRFPGAPVIPGVVVQRHGGPPGGGETPMRSATIVTKCFADSETKGAALYEAVRTALVGAAGVGLTHQTTLMAAGIEGIEEENGPQDIIDPDGPDKGTPYVLSFWQALYKS